MPNKQTKQKELSLQDVMDHTDLKIKDAVKEINDNTDKKIDSAIEGLAISVGKEFNKIGEQSLRQDRKPS